MDIRILCHITIALEDKENHVCDIANWLMSSQRCHRQMNDIPQIADNLIASARRCLTIASLERFILSAPED